MSSILYNSYYNLVIAHPWYFMIGAAIAGYSIAQMYEEKIFANTDHSDWLWTLVAVLLNIITFLVIIVGVPLIWPFVAIIQALNLYRNVLTIWTASSNLRSRIRD